MSALDAADDSVTVSDPPYSVLLAAQSLGRKVVGVEVDERYRELMAQQGARR